MTIAELNMAVRNLAIRLEWHDICNLLNISPRWGKDWKSGDRDFNAQYLDKIAEHLAHNITYSLEAV